MNDDKILLNLRELCFQKPDILFFIRSEKFSFDLQLLSSVFVELDIKLSLRPFNYQSLFVNIRYVIRFALLLLSTLSFHILRGQQITGIIVDDDKKPLANTSVSISKDSTVLKSTLSDNFGIFVFDNLSKGKYLLRFSYNNNVLDTAIELSANMSVTIQLHRQGVTLETVTIVSNERPIFERKIDRLVFNVENSVTSSGLNTLDLINKTPGIKVENGAVSIVGKNDVSLMIDEKIIRLSGDALVEFLKSLPSETVSKIEVITNPSSKYDAGGSSGLINIVRRVNRVLGYNGVLNVGFSQATYSTPSLGLTFNYNKHKTILFGNLGVQKGITAPYTNHFIFYPNQSWFQFSDRDEFSRFIRFSVGAEYTISKKTSVSVSGNGLYSNPDIRESYRSEIFNKQNFLDSLLFTKIFTDVDYEAISANIHLKHDLDSLGKKVTLDLDWFDNKNLQERNFDYEAFFSDDIPIPNSRSLHVTNHRRALDLYTVAVHLDLPSKKYTVSTGSKFSSVDHISNVSLYKKADNGYTLDSNNTSQFKFDENIWAAYVNVSRKLARWNWQLGMRTEFTQIKGASRGVPIVSNSYFAIFPTAFLLYNFNKKNTLSASYSKRIGRPGFQSFNSFRVYSNPYTYQEGNPQLKPSYFHNFEIGNLYKNVFNLSFSYSKGIDVVGALQFVDTNSTVQSSKPVNYLLTHQYLLSTFYSFRKIKWFETLLDYQLFYSKSASQIVQTHALVEGWGASLGLRNSFFFNKQKTVTAAIDFSQKFAQTNGISRYGSYRTLDAGVRLMLLKNLLQCNINLRDVLKSRTVKIIQHINNIEQRFAANNDSRRVDISLRYSFGSSKVKSGRVYSSSQSEQGRAN